MPEEKIKTFYDVTRSPVDFNTDHGRITVHDGCAAGGSWILVEFHDGDLKGKKLWMNNNEMDAVYMCNQSDDGFLFNYPTEPIEGDTPGALEAEHAQYTLMEGGEWLPDLEDLRIVIQGT